MGMIALLPFAFGFMAVGALLVGQGQEGMSELTQWTIRTAVIAAAFVVVVLLIVTTVRYQINKSHEVQQTCISAGGSWISGQCIQIGGAS